MEANRTLSPHLGEIKHQEEAEINLLATADNEFLLESLIKKAISHLEKLAS